MPLTLPDDRPRRPCISELFVEAVSRLKNLSAYLLVIVRART